jgi:transposase
MVCTNKDCEKRIFAEPLAMTHPYGRHTHDVDERIRHEALGQTARKASETLAMQNIHISASACIRTLRLMGKVNPEVRTSGYVGIDDFAKWKGHKYMCVIVDHYTREILAVFDSRYGQEIINWLRSHPEIKVVTRDGSQSYAAIISAASKLIIQVSDRFHIMQTLKKDAVEPIKALLGQKKEKMPYSYPSEDEAYRYILGDICRMGDARHREEVATYYEVARLRDEGKSIAETARLLGIKSQKVRKALDTNLSRILNERQKQAMKVARDMARIISSGCITPATVTKRLEGKVTSGIVHRCMRSVTERYKVLREEVRLHNKALGEQKKAVSVKASTIWNYIVTGKTTSKRLLKLHEKRPEMEQVIQVCIHFRKMLHDEDDAPSMDEWLREAKACQLKEIRGFAEYIRKDRKAVEQACQTSFNNGLLEGTVNKAKAIKRAMFNRAKPEVLRAKMIYSGMKWDWNYHPN